jgi:hypothetical protein
LLLSCAVRNAAWPEVRLRIIRSSSSSPSLERPQHAPLWYAAAMINTMSTKQRSSRYMHTIFILHTRIINVFSLKAKYASMSGECKQVGRHLSYDSADADASEPCCTNSSP